MAPDPREPSASLLQFDHDTVTLLVGPDQERLLLHRAHAQSSGFFKAAFGKRWDDGSRGLALPEDDPHLIRVYLHYLYTGKIACKSPNADTSANAADQVPETELLVRMYVLGEKLQDRVFKNTVVDAIIAKTETKMSTPQGTAAWLPGICDVDIIYRGTCSGSLGRKLMVDFFLYHRRDVWIAEEPIVNVEFLRDVCTKLLEQRSGWRHPWASTNCTYHEHDGDCECETETKGQPAPSTWASAW